MLKRLLLAGALIGCATFAFPSVGSAASRQPIGGSLPPQAKPTPVVTPTPLPGAVPSGPTVDVTAGDEISVRLLEPIGSRISNEGDTFAVETTSDYYFQGKLVLPKGSPGYGVITHIKRAGLFHAGGELSIAVKRLVAPDGKSFLVDVQGATGDANKDTEVNGSSFGQYLMWGVAGLFTKKGNDILLKKGAEFHIVTQDNSGMQVIPYGTNPAPVDLGLVTASGN
jgi:hypothetical protein